MTALWKSTLITGAVCLAAALSYPDPAPAGPICSGFSEEQEHRDPPLSWRFRSCTSTDGQREIHVQFHNREAKPVMFEFRMWTRAQKNCKSEEAPVSQGVRRLAALQVEEWPYTVSTLNNDREFQGRIWVCVKEVLP
ncbi:MAG: hypothetical protein ACRENP_26985 [Longimicrobiales bacterium]